MFEKIIECINSYDTITIYGHQSADGDSLGSTFGLKSCLKELYPSKEVFVLGKNTSDNGKYFPMFDVVSDEIIKKSLAMILDTGNVARIDEQRYALAKEMVKIDHHPNVEPYGKYMVVDSSYSSVCELIVELVREIKDYNKLPYVAASYLYGGLTTDTMGFSTSSANSKSLETGAFLARSGLNLNEIATYFSSREINVYNFITAIRSNLVIEGELAYCIVEKEVYQKFNVDFEDAKNCVSEFSKIAGLKIWSLFTEVDDNTKGYLYQGSLRSRGVIINDIAANFNGGGHTVAAGVRLTSLEEVEANIEALRARIKE